MVINGPDDSEIRLPLFLDGLQVGRAVFATRQTTEVTRRDIAATLPASTYWVILCW